MLYLLLLFITMSTAFADQLKSQEALQLLVEGNQRFARDKKNSLGRSSKQRLAKKRYQNPYAVIVACSDSRVAPEILFDAGIGDLFIVRVAGNIVTDVGLESALYAVTALNTPLILVMGHQNCGAVEAVLTNQDQAIPEIAKLIDPAVKEVRNERFQSSLEKATKLNAINMKAILLRNPKIKKRAEKKELLIEAAYYNFATGKVELLN